MIIRQHRSTMLYLVALANAITALALTWLGDFHAALLYGFAMAAATSAASDTGFLDLTPAIVFSCRPQPGDRDPPLRSVVWLFLALMCLLGWLLAGLNTRGSI